MEKIRINGNILVGGNVFSGTESKLMARWIVTGINDQEEEIIIPSEYAVIVDGDYSLQGKDIEITGGLFVLETLDASKHKAGYITCKEPYNPELI